MRAVKENALELDLVPYNEETKKGQLRHLVVRKGRATGEVMVVLVTKYPKLSKKEAIIELIREVEPNVTSIMQNVNTRNTNVIFGDETNVVWGKAVIED